jgi:SRSO17 transposase
MCAPGRARTTERQAFNYRPGVERWLLIEQLSDNTYKYYLSNLPAETLLAELVRLAHQRWKAEQGHQQLKEELGLDHLEGLSWRGLHHHLTLCFLAYAFLNRVRLHAPKKNADAA